MTYITKWVETAAEEAGLNLVKGQGLELSVFYALLSRVKGVRVTAEDVHDAWVLWTEYIQGDSEHESLIPFEELTPEVQDYDYPYANAIHEVSRKLYGT